MNEKHKSGFVTIVGRPNVGKSTLINNILGQKVAIVSEKNQTTRNCIKGILTEDDYQIIFLDTPGIHKPKNKLSEYMMKEQSDAAKGMDAIIGMVDATTFLGPTDKTMLLNIKDEGCPFFIVVNKADATEAINRYEIIKEIKSLLNIEKVYEISALTGNGVDVLLEDIIASMPYGPVYFPEDIVSDYPEKFLVSEIIREKLLTLLSDEIPHGIGINVEQMKERANDTIYIQADIICERKSHKAIIIGKNGSMIKQVGMLAREELQKIFETKVYLELFVKVQENWRNQANMLKELGYIQK